MASGNRLNIVAFVTGTQRFLFLYDHESAPQVMQTLGKFAADPELCFSWYDAAVLSQKVREMAASHCFWKDCRK